MSHPLNYPFFLIFQPPAIDEPEYIDITGSNNPYEPSYEDYNNFIEDLAPESDAPTSSYGNPGAVITKVNMFSVLLYPQYYNIDNKTIAYFKVLESLLKSYPRAIYLTPISLL